tara:strand:- start:157 stop:381 length:225 start_codon:yes stop_codon:yes gene_type:complete
MIFYQKKNGSCDIVFSDEEVKIINRNKKIHLSPESLKKFGDNLVKMVIEFHHRIGEDIKKNMSYDGIVETKDKK